MADRIIVLSHGRIIQQGTYTQLAALPGLFRELLELQNDRGIPAQRASDPSGSDAGTGATA